LPNRRRVIHVKFLDSDVFGAVTGDEASEMEEAYDK
jgi:hypothetical protein